MIPKMAQDNSPGGLAAFHTFESQKEEASNTNRLLGGVAVAIMIAAVIAYGFETVNAPSPVKPVAATAPHSIATTPPQAANATANANAMANTITPPVVTPPPVLQQQASVPVAPRPTPVHKHVKAAPVHAHSAHSSAVMQRMSQPDQAPADAVVPQQQPLIQNGAAQSSTPPANDASPLTPQAQTPAPQTSAPQTPAAPAQAAPQGAPVTPMTQTPAQQQPQPAPMQ
jgi:hypothetical protein